MQFYNPNSASTSFGINPNKTFSQQFHQQSNQASSLHHGKISSNQFSGPTSPKKKNASLEIGSRKVSPLDTSLRFKVDKDTSHHPSIGSTVTSTKAKSKGNTPATTVAYAKSTMYGSNRDKEFIFPVSTSSKVRQRDRSLSGGTMSLTQSLLKKAESIQINGHSNNNSNQSTINQHSGSGGIVASSQGKTRSGNTVNNLLGQQQQSKSKIGSLFRQPLDQNFMGSARKEYSPPRLRDPSNSLDPAIGGASSASGLAAHSTSANFHSMTMYVSPDVHTIGVSSPKSDSNQSNVSPVKNNLYANLVSSVAQTQLKRAARFRSVHNEQTSLSNSQQNVALIVNKEQNKTRTSLSKKKNSLKTQLSIGGDDSTSFLYMKDFISPMTSTKTAFKSRSSSNRFQSFGKLSNGSLNYSSAINNFSGLSSNRNKSTLRQSSNLSRSRKSASLEKNIVDHHRYTRHISPASLLLAAGKTESASIYSAPGGHPTVVASNLLFEEENTKEVNLPQTDEQNKSKKFMLDLTATAYTEIPDGEQFFIEQESIDTTWKRMQLPCRPQDAIKILGKSGLTEFESKEILSYLNIYYAGHNAEKPQRLLDVSDDAQKQIFNYGYDDENGDYLYSMKDHVAYRYEILGGLGKGSFGQVLKVFDHKRKEMSALKVIRNRKNFQQQAIVELNILKYIRDNDVSGSNNLLKIKDFVVFRSHVCIVFELLSINLYEFLKNNEFKGISIELIRRFAIQILQGLLFLQKHKVIHCDLKPENILLKQENKSGIKIIDFGSSCFESQRVYTYIQSRFYRAPEIILGRSYNVHIDMWSFGCIMAELYMGYPIFPGENEGEQFLMFMEVLGVPEETFLSNCSRKKVFFEDNGQPKIVKNSRGKIRNPSSRDLNYYLRCPDPVFVDFIKRCFTWKPEERISPVEALVHDWILEGLPEEIRSQHLVAMQITSPEIDMRSTFKKYNISWVPPSLHTKQFNERQQKSQQVPVTSESNPLLANGSNASKQLEQPVQQQMQQNNQSVVEKKSLPKEIKRIKMPENMNNNKSSENRQKNDIIQSGIHNDNSAAPSSNTGQSATTEQNQNVNLPTGLVERNNNIPAPNQAFPSDNQTSQLGGITGMNSTQNNQSIELGDTKNKQQNIVLQATSEIKSLGQIGSAYLSKNQYTQVHAATSKNAAVKRHDFF